MATQRRHTRRWTFAGFGALSLAVLLATGLCCWAADVIDVDIDVAPNVLNLQNQGEVVTVHTDLSFSSVLGSSVFLNDVEIASWKADNRGNFVAKFLMEDVKDLDLNIGDYNTLTLTGYVTNGEEQVPFSGTAEILVVNNVPAGKK